EGNTQINTKAVSVLRSGEQVIPVPLPAMTVLLGKTILTTPAGGPAYVPRWTSEKEMTRFMDLVFQHMADTAARLEDYPEQFEP
ncbi:hypothetical protein MJI47_30060, partial [Salmonella enterica subsp. enterica serovar Kentucky]|nr:hypothetical protein [Salmonella enterica subsp. enterica serovar Kentucky]